MPPVFIGSGHELSFLTSDAAIELLSSNETDLAALTSLWEQAGDITRMLFVRLASSEDSIESSSSTAPPLDFGVREGALEDLKQRLTAMDPGPAAPGIDSMEVWMGSTDNQEGVSVTAFLLVGIDELGQSVLVLGAVGDVLDGHWVREPQVLVGDWMYRAFGESEDNRNFANEEGDSLAFSPRVGGKKLKLKALGFSRCFRNCMRLLVPALTPLQIACIAFAALGCVPAGPGLYAVCLLPAITFCNLAVVASSIIWCTAHCA